MSIASDQKKSDHSEPIATSAKAQLFAAYMRAAVGVVCFYAALLFLPQHQVTPILAGVSILMVVTASHSAWQASTTERRLKIWVKSLVWAVFISITCCIALSILRHQLA